MNERLFMRIAKALADPKRFAILERIAAEAEVPCQNLLQDFAITPATMSHHLKTLETAELINMEREGKCVRLSLRDDTFGAYQDELARRLSAKSPAAASRRRRSA